MYLIDGRNGQTLSKLSKLRRDASLSKFDIDNILIPNFNLLTEPQLCQISELFDNIKDGKKSEIELDRWVAELYNIDEVDFQNICNTLADKLPFSNNHDYANKIPTRSQIKYFCKILDVDSQIGLLTKKFGLKVKLMDTLPAYSYTCTFVGIDNSSVINDTQAKMDFLTASSRTNEQLFFAKIPSGLLIGVLT